MGLGWSAVMAFARLRAIQTRVAAMFTTPRQTEIMRLVRAKQTCTVAELAQLFNDVRPFTYLGGSLV